MPCRVEVWGGCAFINFDDQAPSLSDSLGPVAPRLEARNVDKLRMEWWYATVLPTNWKLAMEAFMEGYHVMRTHPQLHVQMPAELSQYGLDANQKASGRQYTARELVGMTYDFMATNGRGMAGMVNLGRLYLDGNGVPKDQGRARNLFETATATGEPGAMRMLGVLYERGITVPKDPAQAKKWYEKAAAA